ncbi:polyketide synthase-like protein [Xylaria sp. FL0043]|nr:polyketide synthase-like protein [Xylaria sp. FL0043]
MPSNIDREPSKFRPTGYEEDPVCIVGMACRLPGEVNSPAELWQLLLDKRSTQSTVPLQRYNISGYYSQEGDKAGVMNVDGGYFLKEDVRHFDNEFFGINNFEAMDPQQRKLLEVVFECFENAGASLDKMSGSNTGVFVGNFSQDHLLMQVRDPDDLRRYHATGAGLTMLANRISHTFNLHGPSLTLDTACSSSIYCLHLACSALKALQCDGAVVAASNLIMAPTPHIAAMKAGMLSPTSACHTFDISADGYARGEGVNAIYLKRLSSAIQSGDNVYAVIRGTAINSNGHTPGMVYPSADLQEAVIRKAYKEANLGFSGTDYIECHGTGTEIGDLVELTALAACFSHNRNIPIRIGGTKPNLGHSEAASSLTSLIKVSMAFQLQLSHHNMEVVTKSQPWPRKVQRASICSFGYGGANAHAILESLPSYMSEKPQLHPAIRDSDVTSDSYLLLPVTATSTKSLEARISSLRRTLQSSAASKIECLCYTLSERLTHFKFRTALFLSCNTSPLDGKWAIEQTGVSAPQSSETLPFGFVFNGQGSQYHAMGKELLDNNATFLATIRELDQVIKGLPSPYAPDWTLEDMLRGLCGMDEIHAVTRSQPVCTAVQIGLVNILESWGVRASATIGHSSGEISAAYASGNISASQAIIAAYFRGYAVGCEPSHGGMLACGLSATQAESLLGDLGYSERVCVACVNSNESITLSGNRKCIDDIQGELQARHIFHRFVPTGGQAYHSPYMEAVGGQYEELLTPYFQHQEPKHNSFRADMYSTAEHGNDGPRIIDSSINFARYWRKNLESRVLFESTLSYVIQKQRYHILEIGSHSVLKASINQIRAHVGWDTRAIPYSPSLIRNQDAYACVKRLAAKLFADGHVLNWEAVNSVAQQNRSVFQDLPPYSWDYSTGLRWFEPRSSIELRNRRYIRHELLGSQQLTGNGVDWTWRNVVRVDELPWIRDHNIDGQIIFPAAGYLAVIIEAATRVKLTQENLEGENIIFEFRDVSFNSALVLPVKDDIQAPVELHTTISLRRLSSKKQSSSIYDFSISSWSAGTGVVHCVGNIRVLERSLEKTVSIPANKSVQQSTMDKWYKRYTEEGLHFGPHFQVLTGVWADRNQLQPVVQCAIRDQPSKLESSASSYPVHPLTIDACFQAAQISDTCGETDYFRAHVPVFISECRIQRASMAEGEDNGVVHAQSQRTGFATLRADCILENSQGVAIVEMKGVQLLKYMGKVKKTTDQSLERHPALKISWKPDIMRLTPDTVAQLELYIAKKISESRLTTVDSEIIATIGFLLDLAAHKDPRMRVVQLGDEHEHLKKSWLNMLGNETEFPRFQSWGSLHNIDELRNEEFTTHTHCVLVYNESDPQEFWADLSSKVKSVLRHSEIVITRSSELALSRLSTAGFSTTIVRDKVILGVRNQMQTTLAGQKVIILTHGLPSPLQPFVTELTKILRALGVDDVNYFSLEQFETNILSEDVVCISTLEIEKPFIATMSQANLDALHSLTNKVKHIVWLTGANMLGCPNPDLALVNGLARALSVEQPALRFAVLDLGLPTRLSQDLLNSCRAVASVLKTHEKDDKEFIYFDGLLQISRFEPREDLNSAFQNRTQRKDVWEKLPLSEAQPARLSIGTVGLTDTMHFQQVCEPYTAPPSGFIDVQIKAVSLNAKDIYTMSGHVETKTGTAAIEFGGVVTAVGPGVTNINVGDRVVVVTPNTFSTTERVPSWTAHKLLPGEEFGVMASLPTIYCAAIYAIRDRANLRSEESVLIHSGAGAFGIAAITIAKRTGATVYATAGSEERRKYLVDQLEIPASHVFSSRNDSFVTSLNLATKGQGVDVIINSLTGDLMHASWQCLSPFGRFVEVGKRELVDDGRLEMNVFARNTTFTAFDLTEMYFQEGEHYKNVVTELIKEVFQLYRSKAIQPVPIKSFDVAEIARAYRYFSSKERIGKVIVSLENEDSLVQVAPPRYLTLLDRNKVYLLVGALGGLGRSLIHWMVSRGARNFVFLQRSGSDKPGIPEFVDQLKQRGARTRVIKGDVTIYGDVVASVAACNNFGLPLGGVVHAAMALHEDLFSRMTSESWHISVRPKWAGTWNLHTALDGYDLDFFLMTSSMNGSVGIPTESNYCAANCFLDAFALWRRSQGRPAVSLGLGMISEVGYLHDNPDIQALLLRRGIQPLDEKTLLQLVDLAIGGTGRSTYDDGAGLPQTSPAHILTGMETTGIQKLYEQGFEVSHSVMDDPRASILAAALEAKLSARQTGQLKGSLVEGPTNIAWLKGLPEGVAKTLRAERNASTLREAILCALQRRFSHLLLTPIDQIDPSRSFAQFGIDSMIAAEFRTWVWSSLKVEVPFLDLLSTRKSLDTLALSLEEQLRGGGSSGAVAEPISEKNAALPQPVEPTH